jgi:uncharacterized protein YbaR (Trm112 family)
VLYSLVELLRCPNSLSNERCQGRLQEETARLTCVQCGAIFPLLSGIPVALPDAAAAVLDWRANLEEFSTIADHVCSDLLTAVSTTERLGPIRRQRLTHLRDGLAAQAVEALGAFAAAGLEARPRTAPPSPYSMKFGVLHYQHHIHRDWAWGDSELAQARRQMELVWPRGRKLGRALFLGVGAARCAAELSHAWHADLAVGIDINPLPLLVAQTLLAGREFKFHEVPASPRSAHEPTVARTLQGRADLGGKLQLVLADGLDPPFAEGSFDTIIADWFFDQVVPDLEAYLPLLRSLMSADGVLLHHGPLVYPSTTPRSHRHTPEELFELIHAAGFEVIERAEAKLPFMESPACNQGRLERVFSFTARLATHKPTPQQHAVPQWLLSDDLPIPRFAGLEHYDPPHPFFAAVVSAIDGRRSCAEIAGQIAEQQKLGLATVTVAVRAAVREVHRVCQDQAR